MLGPAGVQHHKPAKSVRELTQTEKDSELSEGMSGMTLKTSGKSKLLQVLMWRPVRLGRCVMVVRIVCSVSPEQLWGGGAFS